MRICSCCPGGNTSTIRSIDSAALFVCKVANTKCPVSAAVMASWMVSKSRISPTRITSGSSRSAERSAAANDLVSCPSSRWLMMLYLCWWRYSIGSSMVMICTLRSLLIWLIIAASEVDLPDPVGPVTRISPRGRRVSSSSTGGRFSSRMVGTRAGIKRNAAATAPLSL